LARAELLAAKLEAGIAGGYKKESPRQNP